jgi:hypothetical protein
MDFGLTPDLIRSGLIFFFLLFAVLILRAFAQAWLADKFGDPTPRNDGRVTLYPPPHVDLLGTIVLPLICIFYFQPRLAEIVFFLAWTKPVLSNPSYFKHPRRDEVLVQFAGFGMCLLIALLTALIGGFALRADPRMLEIALTLIVICAMLMVLDLLPMPPLPGGMLFRYWGVISEEAFWSISRWSGLAFIVAIQFKPVQMALSFMVDLVASPFVALLRMVAR